MLKEIYDLKRTLSEKNISGIALDIDETLSITVNWFAEKMLTKFGNPENLTVTELITKYKYTYNVPYWQHQEALDWVAEQIESNELQEQLPIIENANTYVNEINLHVPIVAYITNRPETVLSGTKNWLAKHNFSQAPIIARENYIPHLVGTTWKATVLEFLYPQVKAIVDDNASLVKALSKNYPGRVYLYDNKESPRNDIDIVVCKTWQDVVNRIKDSR